MTVIFCGVSCKRGERVAFSCYGIVTSLNGEPESSVAIEAVGVGESCTEYQEESSSEANGQFRIRGLLPQCEYIVGLKSVHGSNIERTLPQNMHVKVRWRAFPIFHQSAFFMKQILINSNSK